jgi:hypothetical protein
MNVPAEMTRLNPSFLRMAAHLLVWIGVALVMGYFWQGYAQNQWWSPEYIATLSVPMGIVIVACWLGFVPTKLAYDEEEIIIHSWWRGDHTYRWEALSHYGGGMTVFALQFGSMQAYQIFTLAYPKSEWNQFQRFLRERFPEKKTRIWIGPFGIKQRK